MEKINKTAIILMTMGGPDSLQAVRPFLCNLFKDRAIIDAPWLIRRLLAEFISRKRAAHAREIYAKIGGKSPIYEETYNQAKSLEKRLNKDNIRCFVAMRYWKPFTEETVKEVKEWGAEKIILLPMYPQFSTTTSLSSCQEWEKQCAKINWFPPMEKIISYEDNDGFIAANVTLIHQALEKIPQDQPIRFIFSAHGLPVSIVKKRKDIYPEQVKKSCKLVMESLNINQADWSLCYQSRVGPMEWIGPSTPDEIKRAGQDRKSIILIPISFVSEHSETLVELDIDYAKLAQKVKIPFYVRLPTVGINSIFINGLAELIEERI